MMNSSGYFTTDTRRISILLLTLIASISLIFFTKRISAQSTTPQLSFSPSSIQATVGSPTTVEIQMETGGQEVGGVGAKMTFDPNLIEIQSVETLPIFPDYPTNTFDNQLGTITISGVVQNVTQLITTSGSFARITFTLKQPQATTIDFIFEPNKTTDSNIAIMSGTGDALQHVTSLSITAIQPATNGIAVPMDSDVMERPMSPELYVTTPPTPEITTADSPINVPLIGLGIVLFAITIGLHLHLSIELKQIREELNHLKKKS